jgi:hypothetical protein
MMPQLVLFFAGAALFGALLRRYRRRRIERRQAAQLRAAVTWMEQEWALGS